MGPIVRRGLIAALLIIPLGGRVAAAQVYEDETGDLSLEVTVIVTISVSGDGFVGDSVVYLTLTAEDGTEVDLGTIPTDENGRFLAEVSLPTELDPGRYMVAATGVTAVGATRTLSGWIGVGDDLALTPLEPATTTETTEVFTARPDRGTGLDPLPVTTTIAPAATEPSQDNVLLVQILAGALVGSLGLWWWSYRRFRKWTG